MVLLVVDTQKGIVDERTAYGFDEPFFSQQRCKPGIDLEFIVPDGETGAGPIVMLEYLTEKGEKDVMVCGIMTDFCINATVEAGFEHGLHMIVPAYANSTQDNEYMTGEQSYHYYNEFLWPDRYADCVPMDKALELLKK